jgi:transposase, IS30 family
VLGAIDRASCWVYLGWVPDGSAAAVAAHVAAWSTQAQVPLCTLTCDQGSEFTHLPLLLPGRLYVCEPGKPYQKGAIENLMGLLRQYLPKGKSLKGLTQAKLDKIADELNHRPRKCLGWHTPAMIQDWS